MSSDVDCSWLFDTQCVYELSYQEPVAFTFKVLAASAVLQIDSDKAEVDVTKITYTLCTLKAKRSTVCVKCRFV